MQKRPKKQAPQPHSVVFVIVLFWLSVFITLPVYGYLEKPKSNERFFDLNKDHVLDWHERSLLYTHKTFGWEMANTKKKKRFDANQDWMLEPVEKEQYEKWKKGR